LGYLFGGWLDEFFGWRVALMMVGVPGILYAVFFYLTVKEPIRGYSEQAKTNVAEYSMQEVFSLLMSRKTFLFIAFAAGFNAFVSYGVGNWMPALLGRLHGMERGAIGTWLALGSGGGGMIGVFIGGYLADRLGTKDKRWYLWIPMISVALSIPLTALMIFSTAKYVVVITNIFVKICWATYLGPIFAMVHGMVGLKMRALSSAVLLLFLNLIGLGLGPLMIGMISDYLNPTYGTQSVRWAMSIAIVVSAASAFLYWRGSVFLEGDLARAPQ